MRREFAALNPSSELEGQWRREEGRGDRGESEGKEEVLRRWGTPRSRQAPFPWPRVAKKLPIVRSASTASIQLFPLPPSSASPPPSFPLDPPFWLGHKSHSLFCSAMSSLEAEHSLPSPFPQLPPALPPPLPFEFTRGVQRYGHPPHLVPLRCPSSLVQHYDTPASSAPSVALRVLVRGSTSQTPFSSGPSPSPFFGSTL